MKSNSRDGGRRLFRPSVRQEVDEELSFHLEMRVRELMAGGLDEAASGAEAVRRFGDIDRVNATCRHIGRRRDRDMRRTAYFSELGHDVRFAIRQLRSAPAFAAVAVFTLALGVGATAAIFSVLDAVALRPLPFAHQDRVVEVVERWQDQNGSVSAGNYVDWKEMSRSFAALSAVDWVNLNLRAAADAERVLGAAVEQDFFDVFGVRPLIGRVFRPEEHEPGASNVVLLSHELWRTRFASDADVVGRSLSLGDGSYQVIGVMPEGYDPMLQGEQLWIPLAFTPERRRMHDEHYLYVVGLLRPDGTLTSAQAELDRIARIMEERFPLENADRGIRMSLLSERLVGPDLRSRLWLLLGAVALVLVIACANVANLLLARAASRMKELAVRASLGAGRGRILRQLFTENLVLALLAGLVGVALAYGLVQLVAATGPATVPRLSTSAVDARALGFALALAVTSSVLFGLLPAFRSAGLSLVGVLKHGQRGTAATVRDRLRRGLIAFEVALALTLLMVAGLLIRTVINLHRVDTGFDSTGVVLGRVTLPDAAYRETEHVRQAFLTLGENLAAMPGVAAAGLASQAPMGPGGNSNGLIPEGRAIEPSNAIDARLRMVTPGYLRALQIRLVRGRLFDASDAAGAQRVMIVSESLARTAWAGQDPIGRRVVCCEEDPDLRLKTVVGVVRDTRWRGLGQDPTPEFYLPITQVPPEAFNWIQQTMTIAARGRPGIEATLVTAMRQAVRTIDVSLPIYGVTTPSELASQSIGRDRFQMVLLVSLGMVGLLLAAAGIFSVVAYFVALRAHEIGVRVALGASTSSVVRLMARQGLAPVAVGLVIGVLLSLGAVRLIRSWLFGVGPGDPITLVVVATLLLAIALAASFIPARRAARVEPVRALNTA